MKTDFEVIDLVYTIINDSTVTDLIDGSIWKSKKPLGRKVKDIVINLSSNVLQDDQLIQIAYFNINTYCEKNKGGTFKKATLQPIITAILVLLAAYNQTGNTYFFLEVTNPGSVFNDEIDKTMSFANIRVTGYVES